LDIQKYYITKYNILSLKICDLIIMKKFQNDEYLKLTK
jgi:hypothetical protein